MFFVHPQIKLGDALKAVSALIMPQDAEKVRAKISRYFPGKKLVFCDMGRSAFKIIIENFNLRNSEILVPGYICDIFYPIFKSYNIKPVFLDVDKKTFSPTPEEIERKLSPKTKAVFLCHTYGLVFDAKKIREKIGKSVVLIEDCAHAFGAEKDGVFAGNFGDVAFFSLYKQFPALRGGLLVCPESWKVDLAKTSFGPRDILSFLNCFLPFSFIFKKFGGEISPKIIRKEKTKAIGGINAVSLGLFSSFENGFGEKLKKRKELALAFREEIGRAGFSCQEKEDNAFCYLSCLVPESLREKRDEIVRKLKDRNVFCTRIWHTPIILNIEAKKEYNVSLDNFPGTVDVASRIINFPIQNYYSTDDIKKIADSVKEVVKKL